MTDSNFIYNDHPYAETLKMHRQNLHMIPELDRDLPKTKRYLLSTLEYLDCHLTFLCDSGICAFFDNGKNETIAFRADMDALPVQETRTHHYRSIHENRMHACGHDGHMSMVLTLGQYIDALGDFWDSSTQKPLKYNVLLIFQPAEETLGGADEICQSGIFAKYNVTKVYGIHMWPFLSAGKITSKPGALLPNSAEINIDIRGKAVHGTAPSQGCDALYIASDYIRRIYTKHAEFPGAIPHFPAGIGDLPEIKPASPDEQTLIHIGKMDSGYVRNVVSDCSRLEGTVRAFRERDFSRIIELLTDTLDEIKDEYSCTGDFSNSDGYPPVINDPSLYRQILPVLERLPGGYEELTEPLMFSDDFSFYGKHAPAIFFLLGTGTGIPFHSVDFDFDESVLISGFELYKELLSC